MTRDEQLAEKARKLAETERKDAERLRKSRAHARATKRAQRDVQEEATARRCARTGRDAKEAGLFVWEEVTVRQLFILLGERLAGVADPVAALEAALGDTDLGLVCVATSSDTEDTL